MTHINLWDCIGHATGCHDEARVDPAAQDVLRSVTSMPGQELEIQAITEGEKGWKITVFSCFHREDADSPPSDIVLLVPADPSQEPTLSTPKTRMGRALEEQRGGTIARNVRPDIFERLALIESLREVSDSFGRAGTEAARAVSNALREVACRFEQKLKDGCR